MKNLLKTLPNVIILRQILLFSGLLVELRYLQGLDGYRYVAMPCQIEESLGLSHTHAAVNDPLKA